MRAILGQQISVKAATVLASRFAREYGRDVKTPLPELALLFPDAHTIAAQPPAAIAKLGVIGARASSIVALAQAIASGELALEPGAEPTAAIERLQGIAGIGPWTANYIAMRALRWPDAFPKDDVVIRKRLGVSAADAEKLSAAWRPWRSYATMYLWLGDVTHTSVRRSTS